MVSSVDFKQESSIKLLQIMQRSDMCVYILRLSNGKYYTGLTKQINKRLAQHQNGHSISTRWHRPVKLVYLELKENRTSARELEVKIKNRGAFRFISSRLRFEEGSLNDIWIDRLDYYSK